MDRFDWSVNKNGKFSFVHKKVVSENCLNLKGALPAQNWQIDFKVLVESSPQIKCPNKDLGNFLRHFS